MLSTATSRVLVLALPLALSAVPAAQRPPDPVTPQGAPAGGQRAGATFKVSVDYVEVTARVTTADGQFVADLSRNDFEVREEGRPQTVANFALVDLPAAPRAGEPTPWREAEPDVRTNAAPADGRVYVLVLDNLHVQPERTRDVRVMARRFLEQYFVDGDIGAVVNTLGAADAAQELTTNRERLISAVDRFAVTVTRLETDEPSVRAMTPGGPTALASDTLSSLEALAGRLGTIRGRRKAIVFFSEGPGFCTDEAALPPPTGGMPSAGGRVTSVTSRPVDEPTSRWRVVLAEGIQKVVAAANRNNVAIYGVDPRQLMAMPADAQRKGRASGADGAGLNSCELDASMQSLRELSDETAGFTIANTNDLGAGFDRLRQENSRYYVLGYYPAERAPDGAYRRIEVRTRRPGLKVDARKGYRVPPRAASPARREGGVSTGLRDAMDSVLPVSGLRLSASAAAFRSGTADADVLVSIEVDGRDITFTPADGRLLGSLELALATMNSRGEKGGVSAELVRLPLDEALRANVAGSGIRIVRSLAVPPGRHQLRVGVADPSTGRTGVVHLDLAVADFRKGTFHMGGLLLSSSIAGRVPTAGGGPIARLQQLLPGPPTLAREFRAGEELALYTELYGTRAAEAGGAAVVSVLDEGGREVYREAQPTRAGSEAESDPAASGKAEVRFMVPLDGLEPGRYLLRVEARPGPGEEGRVRREVPFSVVP